MSTTVDAQNADGMVRAFEAGNRAYQRCLIDPAHCADATLSANYGGAPLAGIRTFIAQLRKDDLRVRYPTADSYYGVVSDATVNADGLSGSITVCGVDGGVVYDPREPANPNDDVIVNDELTSSRSVWSMQLNAGHWKRESVRNVEKWTGVNRCPPRKV